MAEIQIRRLVPEDGPAYIALRRRGLVEQPMAFAASLEDDVTNRPADIGSGLGADSMTVTFGGFDGETLVGCVTLGRERQLKRRHRAWLVGVFVAPEARRRGCARRLLEAAIDHARGLGVSIVALSVSATTTEARRLYEQLGFACWGTEPDALCHDGRLADEHHMVLRLPVA
jgi:GNAT superfamily N-acetyltransferase